MPQRERYPGKAREKRKAELSNRSTSRNTSLPFDDADGREISISGTAWDAN
jgi:hypothetical protein